MAANSTLIALDGQQVWALVVEQENGLRMRLSLDEWERFNFARGKISRCAFRGKKMR
jgi:hypothetical protein